MSNKSTFLTGASGFIGQNILDYFADSQFTVFINRTEVESRENIFRQTKKMDSSIDSKVWINLAGKAHDLSKVQSDRPYWETNYDFAVKVYDQFLRSENARVFIHMSSIKAVADEPGFPLDESTKENPQTVYGKSKLKADQYFMENLPQDGRKVYILRPAMVHGKGNKGNLNSLYKYCQSSLPYILGNYNGNRSYLSIENLLAIISELTTERAESGIYCLSDKETVTSNHLVGIIYQELDKKPSIWKVPRFLMTILATLGEFLPIPVNKDTLKKVGDDYIVKSEKVRSVISADLPVNAEEGLRRTIRSFKSNS